MLKIMTIPGLVFLGIFLGFSGPAHGMELTSPAFQDNGKIPADFARPAAGGRNVSIPLRWSGVPEGTKSLALAMVDQHPVAQKWVHWLVINIPPNTTAISEGASGKSMPVGADELRNSFGAAGYGGPQPPAGTGPHAYVITIYALNVGRMDLRKDAGLAGFLTAIKGKIVGEASLTGYYGR